MSSPALQQQIEYYRARAGEYDQWFYRQGRYDRGPELNRRWFAETEVVAAALDAFRPAGSVLELACGTGIWTERLLRHATEVTAVDASQEVLEIHRLKLRSSRVSYIQADLFHWQPPRRFDVVFFGFWLSHVPPESFAAFWNLVRSALLPGGRFFLVDSLREPTSTAADHVLPAPAATTMTLPSKCQPFGVVSEVLSWPAERKFDFFVRSPVRLDPLPCWRHLSVEEYRRRIGEMVSDIEGQAALRRQLSDVPAKGRDAILAQEKHEAPETLKKSPALG